MTTLVVQNDNLGDSRSKFVKARLSWWRTVATVQIGGIGLGPSRHWGLEPESEKAGPHPEYGMQGLRDNGFRRV